MTDCTTRTPRLLLVAILQCPTLWNHPFKYRLTSEDIKHLNASLRHIEKPIELTNICTGACLHGGIMDLVKKELESRRHDKEHHQDMELEDVRDEGLALGHHVTVEIYCPIENKLVFKINPLRNDLSFLLKPNGSKLK